MIFKKLKSDGSKMSEMVNFLHDVVYIEANRPKIFKIACLFHRANA